MARYTMFLFLARNGLDLTATQAEATAAMLALAERSLSEEEFAMWIEDRTEPR